MTATEVQKALYWRFLNHRYHLYNSYIFPAGWECDYFSQTKSGYCYEVEIKVSRGDFFRDFGKDKHKYFENVKKPKWVLPLGEFSRHEYKDGKTTSEVAGHWIKIVDNLKVMLPHRFYFACPEGLIKPEEVPKYAGLIYATVGSIAAVVREAPFLHKRPMDKLPQILLDKFHFEAASLRRYKEGVEDDRRRQQNIELNKTIMQ